VLGLKWVVFSTFSSVGLIWGGGLCHANTVIPWYTCYCFTSYYCSRCVNWYGVHTSYIPGHRGYYIFMVVPNTWGVFSVKLASYTHCGTYNFEVVPTFLWNLCTPKFIPVFLISEPVFIYMISCPTNSRLPWLPWHSVHIRICRNWQSWALCTEGVASQQCYIAFGVKSFCIN